MTPDMFEGVDPDAQAAIRAYCGWHVAPSITETIVLDGPGSDVLMLPSLRVTDVARVTSGGTEIKDPEWSRAGMVRGSFDDRFGSVEVEFTHGFPADDVVISVIKLAATRLAQGAALSMAGGNVRIGGIAVTVGQTGTSTYADSTGDAYVDKVLAPYRLNLRP